METPHMSRHEQIRMQQGNNLPVPVAPVVLVRVLKRF